MNEIDRDIVSKIQMIKERQLQQYNELKNIKCETTGFKGGNPTISK